LVLSREAITLVAGFGKKTVKPMVSTLMFWWKGKRFTVFLHGWRKYNDGKGEGCSA